MSRHHEHAGKLAFVTGGAGGIGSAVAEALRRSGCAVVVIDLAEPVCAGAQDAVALPTLAWHRMDLGRIDAMDEQVAALVRTFGYPDILVNSAGVSYPAGFADIGVPQLAATVEINLLGLIVLTKLLLKGMSEKPCSHVINIASRIASAPMKNNAVYAASKAGIVALSAQLAIEYGHAGVRINSISPGLISTSMNERTRRDEEKMAQIMARQSLQRIGQPRDVANLVLFLCSENASFIAGTDIRIDGGLH